MEGHGDSLSVNRDIAIGIGVVCVEAHIRYAWDLLYECEHTL